eukprot:GHVQ01037561.1.p1 GENE.GHVQ01037561.1~~GHVQ01037561.1.p1  ORF type:complete len:134 (-),score=12.96 GHVQ01037561.1:826-1227(-)
MFLQTLRFCVYLCFHFQKMRPTAACSPGVILHKSPLSKDAIKSLARAFKWHKAFQQCKSSSSTGSVAASAEDDRDKKLKRYTNFSLEHVWDKYRPLQTHLLLRESVLPNVASNPELLDGELDRMHTVYFEKRK